MSSENSQGPKGTPFVLVVNKDLHNSTQFGVRFKQAGKNRRSTLHRTDRGLARREQLARRRTGYAPEPGKVIHALTRPPDTRDNSAVTVDNPRTYMLETITEADHRWNQAVLKYP